MDHMNSHQSIYHTTPQKKGQDDNPLELNQIEFTDAMNIDPNFEDIHAYKHEMQNSPFIFEQWHRLRSKFSTSNALSILTFDEGSSHHFFSWLMHNNPCLYMSGTSFTNEEI